MSWSGLHLRHSLPKAPSTSDPAVSLLPPIPSDAPCGWSIENPCRLLQGEWLLTTARWQKALPPVADSPRRRRVICHTNWPMGSAVCVSMTSVYIALPDKKLSSLNVVSSCVLFVLKASDDTSECNAALSHLEQPVHPLWVQTPCSAALRCFQSHWLSH